VHHAVEGVEPGDDVAIVLLGAEDELGEALDRVWGVFGEVCLQHG